MATEDFEQQPLTEHLAELRHCLIISLVAVGAGFCVSYYFIQDIGYWFFKPLFDVLPDKSSLIFTSYQEAFFFYLKLAFVGGVLLGSPVIFAQIWRFVAPGLYHHEKRAILPFILLSTVCFLGGGVFGYALVFPPAFRFLVGYSNEYLSAMPSVTEYFSLSLRLLIAFGLIFELPVLMVFLARIGVLDAPFLCRNRKYAVLISFVIAAILTPTPDVVNQVLMGGPLVVLYEIGILAVRVFGRRSPVPIDSSPG